jgi:dihydrofolate reductase
MGKVYYDASMSLDGFITAANVRPEAGLGDNGLKLFEWTNSANPRNREIVESGFNTGAVIVGRTTYELSIPYWGANGPLGTARVPTIVISHSVPKDLPDENVYAFVNGIEAAFETAKQLAGDQDISMVGSKIGQQFLKLGLIDEVSLHVVPVLFGSGTPLFGDLSSQHISLEPIEVIQTPEVIHLRFRVVK